MSKLPTLRIFGATEDALAMEIGKQVVHHIDIMHPQGVTTASARLSVRNCTASAVLAAMRAAEEGRAAEWIRNNEKHRRKVRRLIAAGDEFMAGRRTREEVIQEVMVDREAEDVEVIPPGQE